MELTLKYILEENKLGSNCFFRCIKNKIINKKRACSSLFYSILLFKLFSKLISNEFFLQN